MGRLITSHLDDVDALRARRFFGFLSTPVVGVVGRSRLPAALRQVFLEDVKVGGVSAFREPKGVEKHTKSGFRSAKRSLRTQA